MELRLFTRLHSKVVMVIRKAKELAEEHPEWLYFDHMPMIPTACTLPMVRVLRFGVKRMVR